MNNDTNKEEWQLSLDNRLNELVALDKGWLNGSGEPINDKVISTARKLVNFSYRKNTDRPGIYPMEDGGIHLEWDFETKEFYSISFTNDKSFELFSLLDDEDEGTYKENANLHETLEFIEDMPKTAKFK